MGEMLDAVKELRYTIMFASGLTLLLFTGISINQSGQESKKQIISSYFQNKDYTMRKENIDEDRELETVYSCDGKDYTFSFNENDYTVYEVSPLVKKVIE